jgi:hypothetical protein
MTNFLHHAREGGHPSQKGQERKEVEHNHSLLSSPQVVGGDPSEVRQPGFPIKDVGNDNAAEKSSRFAGMDSGRPSILSMQHVHHPSDMV